MIRAIMMGTIVLSLAAPAAAAPDFAKMAGIGWKLVEVAPRCTLESNVIGGTVAKKVRLYFMFGNPIVTEVGVVLTKPLEDGMRLSLPGRKEGDYSIAADVLADGSVVLPAVARTKVTKDVPLSWPELGSPILLRLPGENLQIDTSDVAAHYEALEVCDQRAISAALGMPIVFDKIIKSARIKGQARALFSPDDYPEEALKNGVEGRTRVLMAVGLDGKVAKCVIERSSGSPVLDNKTCEKFRLLRFEPARDEAGRPIVDIVNQQVGWNAMSTTYAPIDPKKIK